MKQREISSHIFNSILLVAMLALLPLTAFAQTTVQVPTGASPLCVNFRNGDGSFPPCCNGIDDDTPVDNRADFYGATVNGKVLPPDQKCLFAGDTEAESSPSTSPIIPCTDKCNLESVFQLINNIITFFFKVLLIPIFVIILMYAGWQYLAAQGNPGKTANLKKILLNIVLGLVLILTAWLVVKIILLTLLDGSTDVGKGALQFFQ